MPNDTTTTCLKINEVCVGFHPDERIIQVKQADGSFVESIAWANGIRDEMIDIGFPVGNRKDGAVLVELPNETSQGCWRVWVNPDQLVTCLVPEVEMPNDTKTTYLKIHKVCVGLHPDERIIQVKQADGSFVESIAWANGIRDETIDIGFPVGNRKDGAVLVELPNETSQGFWRVWVNPDQLVMWNA